MPAVPKGKVFWRQLMYTNEGRLSWVNARVLAIPPPVDRKPAVITHKHQPGTESQWKLTSTSTLKIRDEDDVDHALALTMNAVLSAATAKKVEADKATIDLKLSKIELSVTVDKKPVGDTKGEDELTKEAQLVGASLQIGKDGNVVRSAADLKRVPKLAQKRWIVLSERILQAVEAATFPLPGTEVTTAKSWNGTRTVPVGTIGPPIPAQADLTYVYKGTRTRAGREEAVVEFTGVLRPEKTKLLHVSGKCKGEAYIDLVTGTVVRSQSTVELDLSMKIEGQTNRASGTLEIHLERALPQ
jgi:hypothetical protein